MAQKKAHPVVRFLVALLIVIAVALVAFYVGVSSWHAAGVIGAGASRHPPGVP